MRMMCKWFVKCRDTADWLADVPFAEAIPVCQRCATVAGIPKGDLSKIDN